MSALVTADHHLGALDRLAPVDLSALSDTAELMTRRDRKYLLADDLLVELLRHLPADHRVLEIGGLRRFGYDTVYFDTPELRSYHAAARARPMRWKIRNRTYLDDGQSWGEVKLRDRRGRTVKHRQVRVETDRWTLLDTDRDFAGTLTDGRHLTDEDVERLTPVLATTYDRVTLLDPAAAGRVTIDLGLRCIEPSGADFHLVDTAIVETKSPGRPLRIDRLLWRLGSRPLRLSKYGTAMAALHPELPTNRWHRTLGTAPFLVHDPSDDPNP